MLQLPKVSVVMPVYNGAEHLRESIESIRQQTFTDWEFIIINEFGSNDGTAEIVDTYSRNDNRIRLVQNEQRLGLAESLNRGIRLAKGQYIARMDSDDLSHPDRFEKQVSHMDANPDVAVCGTHQLHFGKRGEWIHEPPATAEQVRSNLLFSCDLCHSTLMLRRHIFIENDFYYDSAFAYEDFELWTRVIDKANIVNIPEVLGKYRHGESNITLAKLEILERESAEIVARSLLRNLQVSITPEDLILINSRRNIYLEELDPGKQEVMLQRLKNILLTTWEANKRVGYYDSESLRNALSAKWIWAQYNEMNFVRAYCSKRIELLRCQTIHVFGAGKIGRYTIETLQHCGINIAMVIDNDHSKHGSDINGVQIGSLDKYLESATEADLIIVAMGNDREVIKQLEHAGVSKGTYVSILREASNDMCQELLT